MSQGRLSVVIPNWNGRRFLAACLNSLQQQTYSDIEIIVVDNASDDGSQALIRESFPQVQLITLPENRGFTGACNIGMQAASGNIIALLNNDTEVDVNWVEEIVEGFCSDQEIGMVASKMLLFDKRDHFHTAGDTFGTDGSAGNRGAWERDAGQYDRAEYVFGACGGAAAYRKSMLDDIGLLDDDFFFLLEDIDLAWRAQLSGYKALYVPSAVVYHHLSASGGGVTASYYDGRNSIWVLVKNMPGALIRKYAPRILKRQASLAWQALRAWRGAEARARLRGTVRGLLTVGSAMRKRRQIQRSKVVPDTYIDSILSPPK
ncbi:MAG: glycosyltransferase family 2 protein [Chloroflexi bacterium]|nr:glycosyltransferase family 2 protein [Chloroflexota bacterium]